MAFCGKCGAQAKDGAAFCASCGAAVTATQQQQRPGQQSTGYAAAISVAGKTVKTGLIIFGKWCNPTRTAAPLVFAVIGGIIGLLSGAFMAFLGNVLRDAYKSRGISFEALNRFISAFQDTGWMIFFFSIVAIAGGAVARKTRWGSMTLLLAGAASAISVIVYISTMKDALGGIVGADADTFLTSTKMTVIQFTPAILMILGGVLGVLLPQKNAV